MQRPEMGSSQTLKSGPLLYPHETINTLHPLKLKSAPRTLLSHSHLHTRVPSYCTTPQVSWFLLISFLSPRTYVCLCVSPSGHWGSGPAHLGGSAAWPAHCCRALCLTPSGPHRRKQKASRGPGAGESPGSMPASPSLSHDPAST